MIKTIKSIFHRIFFTNISGKTIPKYHYLRKIAWFFLFMAMTSTYMGIFLVYTDEHINIAGYIRLSLYLLFLYSIPISIWLQIRRYNRKMNSSS